MDNLESQFNMSNLSGKNYEYNDEQKNQFYMRRHSAEGLLMRLASPASTSANLSTLSEQRAKSEGIEEEFKQISV